MTASIRIGHVTRRLVEVVATNSSVLLKILIIWTVGSVPFVGYLVSSWTLLFSNIVPSGNDVAFHAWLAQTLATRPSDWLNSTLFPPGVAYPYYFAFLTDAISLLLGRNVVTAMQAVMIAVMILGPLLYALLVRQMVGDWIAVPLTIPLAIAFSSASIQTLADSTYPFLLDILVFVPITVMIHLRRKSYRLTGMLFGLQLGFDLSAAPLLVFLGVAFLLQDFCSDVAGVIVRTIATLKHLVTLAVFTFLLSLPSLWLFWINLLSNLQTIENVVPVATSNSLLGFESVVSYLQAFVGRTGPGYSPNPFLLLANPQVSLVVVMSGIILAGFLVLLKPSFLWLALMVIGITLGHGFIQTYFYSDSYRYLRYGLLLLGLVFSVSLATLLKGTVKFLNTRASFTRRSYRETGPGKRTRRIGLAAIAIALVLVAGYAGPISMSELNPDRYYSGYPSLSIEQQQTYIAARAILAGLKNDCNVVALDSSLWFPYFVSTLNCKVTIIAAPDILASFNPKQRDLDMQIANALSQSPSVAAKTLSEKGVDYLLVESPNPNSYYPGDDYYFIKSIVMTPYNNLSPGFVVLYAAHTVGYNATLYSVSSGA